jgi:hypothetical protein
MLLSFGFIYKAFMNSESRGGQDVGTACGSGRVIEGRRQIEGR